MKIRDHSDDERLPWTDKGDTLVLHSVDGSPVIEFENRCGELWRRQLNYDGTEYRDGGSEWEFVPPNNVLHYMLLGAGHPVADWIQKRRD